ncbi:hypothetical protein BS47DRAFT_1372865 [Hydnum rufescens UP504]|uniref:Uncharacterized protein n=1 Tax=Hydnum rufescens UP504 TaxID=1448309 RepID=A0A9P6AUF9_9AGAM|nr:hypothetical protein BS47DRAFT_1372865 [Hydnum rufescens UP504]
MSANHKSICEDLWKTRTDKINAELFAFTYGPLAVQDYEDYAEVNNYIEFLPRSRPGRCADFKEVGEDVANITHAATPSGPSTISSFTLTFEENPLPEVVELPEALDGGLWFSNVSCGVLRGCLGMVQVEGKFASDVLRGDETTEVKVTLPRSLEEMPAGDD